jgi:hypothetical protein
MPERKPDEEIDRIGRAVRDFAVAISSRTGGVPPMESLRDDPCIPEIGREGVVAGEADRPRR